MYREMLFIPMTDQPLWVGSVPFGQLTPKVDFS
jgi:hypothetical protein